MKSYLDIVKNVLTNGKSKLPYRQTEGKNVTNTIGTFCEIFRHDMSQGFPLVTTKRMPIKTIAVELEGFIKGITDKQWYQDRGCHIWDEWANPVETKKEYEYRLKSCLDLQETPETYKEVQESVTDLGPIYGYQWRNFDGQYGEVTRDTPYTSVYTEHYEYAESLNGMINGGYDQLANIVLTLEKNPTDRRMVCSAWNPNQISWMALPPCHFAWNVVVYDGKLNLVWHQRSCDLMLGVPFNIASYALLLKLLAKHTGLAEGELVGTLNDCHIYENHIEAAKVQVKRTPYSHPSLEIPNNEGDRFNIWSWDHTQLELTNYQHHSKLEMEVTI